MTANDTEPAKIPIAAARKATLEARAATLLIAEHPALTMSWRSGARAAWPDGRPRLDRAWQQAGSTAFQAKSGSSAADLRYRLERNWELEKNGQSRSSCWGEMIAAVAGDRSCATLVALHWLEDDEALGPDSASRVIRARTIHPSPTL